MKKQPPTIKDILARDAVQVLSTSTNTWQQAINIAMLPLVGEGACLPKYVDAIIQTALELGPYFMLCPGVALLHARPRDGAKKLALGATLFSEKLGAAPVNFARIIHDPSKQARLLISLTATSSNAHIDVMAELANILSNADLLDLILSATSADTLYNLLTTQKEDQ